MTLRPNKPISLKQRSINVWHRSLLSPSLPCYLIHHQPSLPLFTHDNLLLSVLAPHTWVSLLCTLLYRCSNLRNRLNCKDNTVREKAEKIKEKSWSHIISHRQFFFNPAPNEGVKIRSRPCLPPKTSETRSNSHSICPHQQRPHHFLLTGRTANVSALLARLH